MVKMMIDTMPRLKEVNDIIDTCSDGTMSFGQANVIARFYYDYQDTTAEDTIISYLEHHIRHTG